METLKSRKAIKAILTDQQIALIVGSLLGDGYLVKTTSGFAFRVNHGLTQKAYVDWKYEILKNITNSKPRKSSNVCYYFRTISHPAFIQLRSKFYKGRRKIVPKKLLKKVLTPFVLAVWIMDDGSRDGNQLRINSQCFSEKENIVLQKILYTKLGIKTTLNKDKNMYRLRIKDESMRKLKNSVSKYIIPSMRYKLSL